MRLENEGDDGDSAKQEKRLDLLGPRGRIITEDEVQNTIQELISSVTNETGIKSFFLLSTVPDVIRFRMPIA